MRIKKETNMKITRRNFKEIIPKEEQEHLNALLDDLEDVNLYSKNKLYFDWQDYHDEYSCERTDPCPDYYGYYTLRFEKKPNEIVGDVMTIDELDNALCILFSYNFLLCELPLPKVRGFLFQRQGLLQGFP